MRRNRPRVGASVSAEVQIGVPILLFLWLDLCSAEKPELVCGVRFVQLDQIVGAYVLHSLALDLANLDQRILPEEETARRTVAVAWVQDSGHSEIFMVGTTRIWR